MNHDLSNNRLAQMGLGIPPPPPTALVNGLVLVAGLWYSERHIQLDGYYFKNCRFDNCVLYTATGNFEMERCKLDHCTQSFYDPSLRTVKLFLSPYSDLPASLGSMLPEKFADGTISILRTTA